MQKGKETALKRQLQKSPISLFAKEIPAFPEGPGWPAYAWPRSAPITWKMLSSFLWLLSKKKISLGRELIPPWDKVSSGGGMNHFKDMPVGVCWLEVTCRGFFLGEPVHFKLAEVWRERSLPYSTRSGQVQIWEKHPRGIKCVYIR